MDRLDKITLVYFCVFAVFVLTAIGIFIGGMAADLGSR